MAKVGEVIVIDKTDLLYQHRISFSKHKFIVPGILFDFQLIVFNYDVPIEIKNIIYIQKDELAHFCVACARLRSTAAHRDHFVRRLFLCHTFI